jgi:hypothetical protein
LEALIQFQIEQMDGAGIPSPCDKTSDTWWWDFGSSLAKIWADAGITDVLTLPIWKGQNMGNNYDIQSEYNIGQPNPTRPGSREQLQRFAAICKRNGLGLHTDAVLAHRCGWGTKLKSASGNLLRFPKDKNCFSPPAKKDNVAVPSEDFAYLFGSPVSYYSGYYGDGQGESGHGYMLREVIKAIRWLFSALDLQGARWDNVKSLDPSVIRDIVDALVKAGHPCWGTGEMWSSNMDQLLWWIFGSNVEAKSSLFDFPLAFEIRNLCNNTAKYDMRKLQYTGLYQRAPMNAVTFVNSHDMDTSSNRVVFNMLTGYALALTLPGLPCIYVKDWLEKIGYGLEDKLENLLWCRRILGQGSLQWRYSDYNTIVYERMGSGDAPGLLVGINNNSWAGPEYVNVQTHWGANQKLHDYSGHMPDVTTDWQGKATIGVPKNVNGRGYCMYAPNGYQSHTIPRKGGATTQRFEGAKDLDILPAAPSGSKVMRIYSDANHRIKLDKPAGDGVRFSVTDADGNEIIPRGAWAGETRQAGWHTVTSFAPGADPSPYTVDITYTAPETI